MSADGDDHDGTQDPPPTDFAAEGLLDGLEGDARTGRLELLRRLEGAGVALDELRAAVAEDRLALLPVEQVMYGDRTLTAADVAHETGLEADFVVAVTHALGLPRVGADEPVYAPGDVDAFRSLKLFREAGLPDEGLLEVTQVLGQSMLRVAGVIRQLFGAAFLRAGDTERDLALRYADAAEHLGPAVAPLLDATLTAHMRELLRTDVVGRAERESGRLPGATDVTVCFADLSGFTRLGTRVGAEQLGSAATRLTRLAMAVADPPVRLIKTIGDAAMFVSREPGPMVRAALELVARAEDDEGLPSIHAGLAHGPALARGGDWYGHTVNLAARVAAEARPGTVLVTEELKEALSAPDAGPWRLSYAGRHRLRGVKGAAPLHRVRSAGEEARTT